MASFGFLIFAIHRAAAASEQLGSTPSCMAHIFSITIELNRSTIGSGAAMGRRMDETCEDAAILMTGLLLLMQRKKSDLCKRAHLANTGNGPCLNSSDQDLYDRERTSNNAKM